MKILFVHRSYYPAFREGGDTMVLFETATALAKLGHEVSVCATNSNADQNLPDNELGQKLIEGVRVFRFPRSMNRIGKSYRFSWALLRFLVRNAKSFDLVHIWSIFSFTTLAGAIGSILSRTPFIVSPQANFSPVAFAKNRTAKQLYLSTIERLSLGFASGIQCNTQFDAKWAVDRGIPKRKILPVVTYGIQNPLHPQTLYAPDPTDKFVLFVGRLDKIKALDFFLGVLSQLNAEEQYCSLKIAGPKDPAYFEFFTKLVHEHNLSSKIEMLEFISHEEKSALLQRCVCLILPSYTESFGLVVVEAMAAGTPVVISDQCNVREHVLPANCGLVLPHDKHTWVESLRKLVQNPDLCKEYGTRGKSYYSKYLTIESSAQGFASNYQRLIQE